MNKDSFVLNKSRVNKELTNGLQHAEYSLLMGMQQMNPSDLAISEYNQKYLADHLRNLEATLENFSWMLGVALFEVNKPLTDIIFVEYGGGTGFLSLLAKKLGIGTVIYNDIYDISCKDAREIALALKCPADYYVQGDIDDLISFCRKYAIRCDSIASSDVIEHIYNIDDFLSKLHLLSHRDTIMVHSTGANAFFYPMAYQLSKEQNKVENEDRQNTWGHKERDCLLAYKDERKKIIKSYTQDLGEDEVQQLAKATRGLKYKDIVTAVDNYMRSNKLPELIEHPTNTCDPHTGNWSEHLMNPYYLTEALTFNGFAAEVLPLPWHRTQHTLLKKAATNLLSIMASVSNAPLYFSRGYVIYARYNESFLKQEHKQHIHKYRRSLLWWYSMLPVWQLLYGVHGLITRTSRKQSTLGLEK